MHIHCQYLRNVSVRKASLQGRNQYEYCLSKNPTSLSVFVLESNLNLISKVFIRYLSTVHKLDEENR